MVNKKGNRQIERTRKTIVNAYLSLLQESPSKKIYISEICQRGNISRPTFYNHFQTKDDVLITYLDEILDKMFIEYRELNSESEEVVFSNFKLASTHFFSLWQSKSVPYQLLKSIQAESLLIEKLKDHHRKTYHIIAIPEYTIKNPDILEYFISHISYTFFSVLDQWMENGMKRTPEEMGEILGALYDPLLVKSLAEKFN